MAAFVASRTESSSQRVLFSTFQNISNTSIADLVLSGSRYLQEEERIFRLPRFTFYSLESLLINSCIYQLEQYMLSALFDTIFVYTLL